ncbi:hypothetical protein PAMA_000896 [Pampus argenteus]
MSNWITPRPVSGPGRDCGSSIVPGSTRAFEQRGQMTVASYLCQPRSNPPQVILPFSPAHASHFPSSSFACIFAASSFLLHQSWVYSTSTSAAERRGRRPIWTVEDRSMMGEVTQQLSVQIPQKSLCARFKEQQIHLDTACEEPRGTTGVFIAVKENVVPLISSSGTDETNRPASPVGEEEEEEGRRLGQSDVAESHR